MNEEVQLLAQTTQNIKSITFPIKLSPLITQIRLG